MKTDFFILFVRHTNCTTLYRYIVAQASEGDAIPPCQHFLAYSVYTIVVATRWLYWLLLFVHCHYGHDILPHTLSVGHGQLRFLATLWCCWILELSSWNFSLLLGESIRIMRVIFGHWHVNRPFRRGHILSTPCWVDDWWMQTLRTIAYSTVLFVRTVSLLLCTVLRYFRIHVAPVATSKVYRSRSFRAKRWTHSNGCTAD